MNHLQQIEFIKKSTGLLDRISQEDIVFYNQLKDITDNFTDLSEDIFNEGAKLGIAKIYNKLKASEEMADLKQATRDNPNVIIATMKDEEENMAENEETSWYSDAYERNRSDSHVPLDKWDGFDESELSQEDLDYVHQRQDEEREQTNMKATGKKPKAEKPESGRKKNQLLVGDNVRIEEEHDENDVDNYDASDLKGTIVSIKKEGDDNVYIVETVRGTFEFYRKDLNRIFSEDVPMPKAKIKVGQHIKFKHDIDSPNKNKPKTLLDFGIIESVRGVDERGEISYYVTWATGVKGGVIYEDHITKVSEKEYNEGIEKVKNAEANPKKVEPEYKGGFVGKESIEHRIVSRFLGLRAKNAPESLVLNAYSDLQKKIANQEIRKINKFADLIMAIQGSYYNLLTKSDVKTLVLSERFMGFAIYLFENERRYSSVKLMSEFAGWTGKSKSLKQIELFVKKAENVVKEGKGTDPYYEELKGVVKSLKSAKEGQSIVPELIGLSGLGSIFAIKVIK